MSARDFYELAACGLLATSPQGAIHRANRAMCTWLGYTHAELVGKRFQDFLTIGSKLFHYTQWMPLLQMQGSIAEVQLELVARDGRVLPVLVNAVQTPPSDEQPSCVDIAVFVATDRRKYERELLLARNEFRTLAENSPDLILRVDASGCCLYANPQAESLLGLSAEKLIGRSIAAIPGALSLVPALEDALAGREATSAFSYEDATGATRELEARVVPERDVRGVVMSAIAMTRDVTLLRQHERESHQRANLAEQLVGIVSHDLRNPLNVVLLGAHLLEGSQQGAQARVVHRIAAAAERANRLVADLLDFTQARLGGGLRVRPQRIDLHVLVAECVEELRLAWPGRMLAHRRDGSGEGEADPDRLAQVVGNLVNNALVYGMPDDAVTLTTSTTAAALTLQVHNSGAPIADALIDQIFEPLQRGEHQVTLGSRSVGLGLYIVKQITLAHGGSVAVRSKAGEGTTFCVTLPRVSLVKTI